MPGNLVYIIRLHMKLAARIFGFCRRRKEPQTPAPGFGERAYFFYPKPDKEHQGNVAFLVAKSGSYTIELSLDAPTGKPAESMCPALE